jgi:hypothetical protein
MSNSCMKKDERYRIKEEKLQKEILLMVEDDQRMRNGDVWDVEIDKKHTERMKEMIQRFGWPGMSLVGKDGTHGAWLLVQHADQDVDFQKQALALLQEAVENRDAEKCDLAYLMDRVRVNSGELQIFGTQFYRDQEGRFVPRPIENEKRIEERRKEFGLEPFFDYEKRMQETNKRLQEKYENRNHW